MGGRLTLALVAVLVVLAVGAYVAFSPPEPEVAPNAPVMWQVERDDIVGFQITRRGHPAQAFVRRDGRWQMEPDGGSVPSGSAEGVVLILAAPSAKRRLPASDDFGLDNPVLTVRVDLAGAPPLMVRVGDPTPASAADYVRVGDQDAVFIVPSAWRRALVAFSEGLPP
ncbi:MAG: DUF4340 domain-containing protein [Pseudomonadota bacterium]